MKCNHCGQDMDPGQCGYEPAMCPNVALFMGFCRTDTLTRKTYEADSNPIHCTESHVKHAALVDKYIEEGLELKY